MRQGFRNAAAILFFVAAFSPAQALVIGVADPGQANSIPFGQTSGGFVYQQVYNATNFNASMNINEITFYNSTLPGGTPMTGHFDIYLSETTAQVGALPTDVPAGFPNSRLQGLQRHPPCGFRRPFGFQLALLLSLRSLFGQPAHDGRIF
jgi:hypothetical protein